MFGREKKVAVHARGENEATQQKFIAEVQVPESQVWEQDAVAGAVASQQDISQSDYRLDSWSRADGQGKLFKRGK